MFKKFVSGYGQFHTNENDPSNPNKTLTQYLAIGFDRVLGLVDEPPTTDKATGQWLIPSSHPSRNFKQQEQYGSYSLLWADLDKNPLSIDKLAGFIESVLPECDYEIFNTRSATFENQKARILIPINKPIPFNEWNLFQQIFNDKLEAIGITPDRASERAAQLCYLPNKGDLYGSKSRRDNVCFDPSKQWKDEINAKRDEVIKQEEALRLAQQHTMAKRTSLRVSQYPSLIQAFNATYTPQELMLKAGYVQRGNSFRHPNSESGSFSASVKPDDTGLWRVNSLSPNDPLYSDGNGAHDAFSAFSVLLHGDDRDKALRDAGDNWLAIDAVPYNKAVQAEYKANFKQKTAFSNVTELFSDITLTQAHVEKMENTKFLIDDVIVKSAVSAFAAPANGGKSALFRQFAADMAGSGMAVLYVNVDASPADLKRHYAQATAAGYGVIAPDVCTGKSISDVVEKIKALVERGDDCNGVVLILDTLKKFTDMLIKKELKAFLQLLRKLNGLGATVCLLCHTNKYKDADGNDIYEGTADLRNDVDNLIYFDSFLNDQTNILEVTTRPDKVRADFKPISYFIDRNNGLAVTLAGSAIPIIPKDDKEIVDAIADAIKEGCTSQGQIIDFVGASVGVGDRKTKAILSKYKDTHFQVTKTGKGRQLSYSLAA